MWRDLKKASSCSDIQWQSKEFQPAEDLRKLVLSCLVSTMYSGASFIAPNLTLLALIQGCKVEEEGVMITQLLKMLKALGGDNLHSLLLTQSECSQNTLTGRIQKLSECEGKANVAAMVS